MSRFLRRYAVEIAIVLGLIGACVVVATEPVRERQGMGLIGPVRG